MLVTLSKCASFFTHINTHSQYGFTWVCKVTESNWCNATHACTGRRCNMWSFKAPRCLKRERFYEQHREPVVRCARVLMWCVCTNSKVQLQRAERNLSIQQLCVCVCQCVLDMLAALCQTEIFPSLLYTHTQRAHTLLTCKQSSLRNFLKIRNFLCRKTGNKYPIFLVFYLLVACWESQYEPNGTIMCCYGKQSCFRWQHYCQVQTTWLWISSDHSEVHITWLAAFCSGAQQYKKTQSNNEYDAWARINSMGEFLSRVAGLSFRDWCRAQTSTRGSEWSRCSSSLRRASWSERLPWVVFWTCLLGSIARLWWPLVRSSHCVKVSSSKILNL